MLLMTNAPHVEHVLMNVLLKQYQRATSIELTRMYALTVVPVLMFARLRRFILYSIAIKVFEGCIEKYSLFYWGLYFAFSRIP